MTDRDENWIKTFEPPPSGKTVWRDIEPGTAYTCRQDGAKFYIKSIHDKYKHKQDEQENPET